MPWGEITPTIPSGSTNGRMVEVTGTTTGTSVLLHTATSSTDQVDVVTIYACNRDLDTRVLTIEFGGTANSDLIPVNLVARSGLNLVVKSSRLNGGVAVRAFASAANLINCLVVVDRYNLES